MQSKYFKLQSNYFFLLFQMCKGPRVNSSPADTPDTDLLGMLGADGLGRLKRLEERLIQPHGVVGPCPPPSFPGHQEFFRDFLQTASWWVTREEQSPPSDCRFMSPLWELMWLIFLIFVISSSAVSWTSTYRTACVSNSSSWTRCPSWVLLLLLEKDWRRKKMETWSSRYTSVSNCHVSVLVLKMEDENNRFEIFSFKYTVKQSVNIKLLFLIGFI